MLAAPCDAQAYAAAVRRQPARTMPVRLSVEHAIWCSSVHFFGLTGDVTRPPIFLSVTVTSLTGSRWLKCVFLIST